MSKHAVFALILVLRENREVIAPKPVVLERNGTARDSVLYSILATEWPDVKRHIELRLSRR